MMSNLKIALPSKGALDKDTRQFFAAAGLKVSRPNERQYVGTIPALGISVLFQRAADIFTKVAEESVDLGITGYDIVRENGRDYDNVIVICHRLGYGGCDLVLAVPDSWIDVTSSQDLADLTLVFKEKGRDMRIATKYPNLTRQWFYSKRIVNFSLVEAHGALEAAPSMGYADAIVDLTSTGTTLRENRLKRLLDGNIIESEACLIGNRNTLKGNQEKLATTKVMLELIEAHSLGKKYISLTANVRGNSPEEIGQKLTQDLDIAGLAGLAGPTVAKVYGAEDDCYGATIVVAKKDVSAAVEHLRRVGGRDITGFTSNYIFGDRSNIYEDLITKLNH